MANELTPSFYPQLVHDLTTILQKGKEDALNAVNSIRLQTYWEVGKRLSESQEFSDADQAKSLLSRLADDLKMDLPLLYRIQQFYRLWPKKVPTGEDAKTLSWSHFVELLSIKDAKERDYYFETASTENWSRDVLRKAIQKDVFTASKKPKKLSGKNILERPENPLHVYKAVVEKVVDGDTLLVRIDLGFDVWVNARTRFRGINTAEIIRNGVPAGSAPDRAEEAKAFVEKKLKGIEFIVIKTYKTDMYGRYVADIFYHPTIDKKEKVYEKGFFLNQQLLAAELADQML